MSFHWFSTQPTSNLTIDILNKSSVCLWESPPILADLVIQDLEKVHSFEHQHQYRTLISVYYQYMNDILLAVLNNRIEY